MASYGVFMNFCRKCQTGFGSNGRLWLRTMWRRSPKICLLTSSPLFVHCQVKEKLDLQAPDASKLSQEYLLKAASAQTADAVTTLLSQTAHAVIETERKYRETMNVLMQLLDYHLTILGNKEEEDRIWDIILQGRDRVDTYDKHVKELRLMFTFVYKLVDASAEVAFLAGSEFTSTSLGERLYNAQRHIDNTRQQSEEMETQLREVQANCIQKIAEHAEKNERLKKAEEELFAADLPEEDPV